MLCNSMLAAALGTAYVIALVLLLNPHLPLNPARLPPLVASVGLFYAVHLTVIFYILLVLRQLFAREIFSPAWISVGVLVWLSAVVSAAGAALMWMNLRTFALVLDAATASALDRSAIVLTAAAVLCVLLAIFRRSVPEAKAVWAVLLVLVGLASVAGPLALRGRGTPPVLEARPIDAALDVARIEPSARVTMIAIDAGSLDLITRAAAEGRLPNFGRILDTGAVRHLATRAPDLRRSGVGRGGDRQAAAEERRPLGRRSISSPAAGRFSCCPTTAWRTGSSGSAF